MAWDSRGRWIPDPPVAQTMAPPLLDPAATARAAASPETVSVTADQQQLTGLLGRRARRAARRDGRADREETPRTPRDPRNPAPGTPPVPGTGAGTTTGQPTPAGTVPASPQPFVEAEPTYADASVEGRLTGLLSSDSPYMQAARKGGIRTAARRGLLNSSIAAGSGEAAAIAAAAPIASQDAQQIHQANQSKLESHLQFGNATRLQSQQDAAAMARQLEGQKSQASLQAAELKAAMDRLGIQVATEKEIAAGNRANAITQTQISANASLVGNYLQAFGSMAQNPEIPAETRNAYIAEMKAVISQGMGLTNQLAGVTINWGTAPSTTAPKPATTTTPTTPTTTTARTGLLRLAA